ncbi:MAG: TRL domain-containing protein [Bacteroidota bacterium]|nr:TRL domain-containing protein [Bacteroidota bacterium]
MKNINIIIITFFIILLSSCTTISPLMVTQNNLGAKQGKSRAAFLFGKIALDGGDYSTGTAARNGGVSKIATVDLQVQNYLGIVIIYTTLVGGE